MNTVQENLEIIKTAFKNIKDSIENKGGTVSECTPVSEYAAIINDLPTNMYQGTFMVFKQSEEQPDTPEGGSWSESGFIYPYGWSPEQKSRRSVDSGKTWMSFAVVTKEDNNAKWSTPIQISGKSSIINTTKIDNVSYWTINGELLYDEFGNKIKAEALDGINANSAFTSYVFTRSSEFPDPPQGGDHDNPYPEDNMWFNYIPEGEGTAYMSSRVFSSDGKHPQQSSWTDPSPITDTQDLDFAFSSNIARPDPPVEHGDHSDDANWNNHSDENTVWMAMSKNKNGQWGSWEISKIKGPQGEPGIKGDSKLIYPAGEWDANKRYLLEYNKTPYVYFQEKYYVLNSEDLLTVKSAGSVIAGPDTYPGCTYGDEAINIWLNIESFEAIYSDIGLFKQALVGKWVFCGNYMFSQEGTNSSGETATYEDYSEDIINAIVNEQFIPNVCINAVTGSGWFSGKKFEFNSDGSGQLGNGIIRWTKDSAIITEGSTTKYVYGPIDEYSWVEPESVVNIIYIQPTKGDGDIGYNKSHNFVLNLDNYLFKGEVLTICNLAEDVVYLWEYVPGENAHYEFLTGGLSSDEYDNFSNKLQAQRASMLAIQPYSEIKLRLYNNPNIWYTEDCNYAQVISSIVPFYHKVKAGSYYTNSALFNKDVDNYFKNLDFPQVYNSTLSNTFHKILDLNNPGFSFIKIIADGDKTLIDGGDDRCQIKVTIDGTSKTSTYEGVSYIHIDSGSNITVEIDSSYSRNFRIQYYYKDVCLGELEHSLVIS